MRAKSSIRFRRFRHLAFATVIALAVAVVAPTVASAGEPGTSGSTIVYSPTYRTLIAEFPAGWGDGCDLAWVIAGKPTGYVCDARIDPVYFYPDGTFGKMPWYVDASSPTGWSVEADPCTGLTDEEYALWAVYVDWSNGYFESGPDLTPEQIDRYGACWGWWF